MLLCTVRGSGYVNLLQPQERRSRRPGDSSEVVAARRRLHERGVTQPTSQAIESMLAPTAADRVLDAGCGDGWLLGGMQSRYGFAAFGIDISTPAIELAARRFAGCTWIIANADRLLPLAAGSMTKVLSVTGRGTAAELRRVLEPGGVLLVAVAAPDDLIELRGAGKDRAAKVVQELSPHLDLVSRQRVTAAVEVDEAAVRDLRLSIYRPRGGTDMRTVTLSLDLLLFGG